MQTQVRFLVKLITDKYKKAYYRFSALTEIYLNLDARGGLKHVPTRPPIPDKQGFDMIF
jgi:hypothetical protein